MVHRLFVALTPPEPVRDALVDMMEALDHARWVDEENLHLTLRFVGEVERRGADDLAAALSRVRFAPFAVTLASVGHFARRGVVHALHARVLPTPPLLALRAQVERAAIAAGQPPETRAFVPHVTLARVGGPRATRSSAALGEWMARHNKLRATWTAEHFALVESHLGKAGAVYEERVRYPGAPA